MSEVLVVPDAVQVLLDALGQQIGADLSLDDGGQCALLFDHDVELVISLADECLLLRAPLAVALDDKPKARLRRALALNYTMLLGEGAIGLDEHSEQLLLLVHVDARICSPADFVMEAAMMVGMVPELRERLAGGEVSAPLAQELADAPLDPAHFLAHGIRG